MQSAKLRNGRAVLYSSATTDKVNAMSTRVVCDMAFNHNMEFRGCNDIDITLG